MLQEKISWGQMSPSLMPFCVPGANPISEQVFFMFINMIHHLAVSSSASCCCNTEGVYLCVCSVS